MTATATKRLPPMPAVVAASSVPDHLHPFHAAANIVRGSLARIQESAGTPALDSAVVRHFIHVQNFATFADIESVKNGREGKVSALALACRPLNFAGKKYPGRAVVSNAVAESMKRLDDSIKAGHLRPRPNIPTAEVARLVSWLESEREGGAE